jgi:hypothetical protein
MVRCSEASRRRRAARGGGVVLRGRRKQVVEGIHLRVLRRSLTTHRGYGKRRSQPESYFRVPRPHASAADGRATAAAASRVAAVRETQRAAGPRAASAVMMAGEIARLKPVDS